MTERVLRGGDKLEAALRAIARKLDKPATLRVGFLENATYPDGTSVAQVAAWNEFGSKTAPPRPFFRNMIAAKSDEWGPALAGILESNGMDATKALETLGSGMVGQLQESIINTNAPPLSPITIMLRGMRSNDQSLEVTGATVGEAARRVAAGLTNYGASSKPLVDSSHMLNSVDYAVTGGES